MACSAGMALALLPQPPCQALNYRTWRPAPQPMHLDRAQQCRSRGQAPTARRGGGASTPKRKSKKKAELDEVAAFEQLMCDWDDAFAADCCHTERAARMARLGEEGYQQHGRGFVFVRSKLDKRPVKAGSSSAAKGFGAPTKARAVEKGTPLENNPQLHLLSWAACYIPSTQLDSLGGLFSTQQGALLPDSSSLLADVANGAGSSSSSGADADAIAELQRVLRGQDLSQLRGYVGAPPPRRTADSSNDSSPAKTSDDSSPANGSDGSSSDGSNSDSSGSGITGTSSNSSGGGEAGEAEQDGEAMAGVRRYEPEANEVVVLLSCRIDGKPALGAELLVVARAEDGSVALELPDGWEQLMAAT